MVDLQSLIAKQRSELDKVKVFAVDVTLGGRKIAVGVRKVSPDQWDMLVASNPPRPGIEGDAMVGYNPKGVTKAYPNIEIDGEIVDAETWAEVYSVLDSVWRNSVEVTIWHANIQEPMRARPVGKARAGRKSH